jgi:hypothetical protein
LYNVLIERANEIGATELEMKTSRSLQLSSHPSCNRIGNSVCRVAVDMRQQFVDREQKEFL